MKKNKEKKHKGFSLIELLIVIAIIGIMTAISWKTLVEMRDTSNAKNACEEAAGAINQARNYALSGKCAEGGTKVTIDFSKKTITMPACSENFSLPKGVSCEGAIFNFRIPSGEKINPANSLDCQSGSATKTVTVDNFKAYCD